MHATRYIQQVLIIKILRLNHCRVYREISLTGSGDVREFLALLPPVDILLLLLTSMSGRREDRVEELESNDPVRYLASNDGDATEDKNVIIHSRHHIIGVYCHAMCV